MANENIEYLGDSVYAEWNGFSIELKVNSHLSETVVYLDPEILEALNNFYKKQTEK